MRRETVGATDYREGSPCSDQKELDWSLLHLIAQLARQRVMPNPATTTQRPSTTIRKPSLADSSPTDPTTSRRSIGTAGQKQKCAPADLAYLAYPTPS